MNDAIDKNKLIQFPLTIQKNILNYLNNISTHQANLLSGRDEVTNLVNAIEVLFVNVWSYNIQNYSDELLGFETKMNQLKIQEVKAQEYHKELTKGLKLKKDIEGLLTQIQESTNGVQSLLTNAQNQNNDIKLNLDKSLENAQQSSAHLATVQQNDTNVTQLLANSKTNEAQIATLETKITEFYKLIDTYKKAMSETTDSANNTVIENDKQSKQILNYLNELEDQIKDQLLKATGYSLFHSFQTRQGDLNKSKNIWIYAIGFILLATIGLTAYIAHTTTNFDIAFYLKLSMSVPFIFAITFCTVQYSRERKLEEEYAFKSNISISLIPYQQLVEKLVNNQNPQEREKYTNFIIESINKVFTSPTDKVFEQNEEISHLDPESAIKNVSKVLDAILKPLEPIIKLLKH